MLLQIPTLSVSGHLILLSYPSGSSHSSRKPPKGEQSSWGLHLQAPNPSSNASSWFYFILCIASHQFPFKERSKVKYFWKPCSKHFSQSSVLPITSSFSPLSHHTSPSVPRVAVCEECISVSLSPRLIYSLKHLIQVRRPHFCFWIFFLKSSIFFPLNFSSSSSLGGSSGSFRTQGLLLD